jgi:aryl-alcohol dehydrogenase-like predicted oxidoreductase
MEKEYLPLFKHYGYGTTVWSPLAGGMLAGRYLTGIPEDSRAVNKMMKAFFYDEHMKEDVAKVTLEKLHAFKKMAEELECSMASLAVAWCLKYDKVSTAIIGASKVSQVEDTVTAVEL